MGLRKAKRLLSESTDYLVIVEVNGEFRLSWHNDESFGLLLNVAINSPHFRLLLEQVVVEAADYLNGVDNETE